MKVQIKSRFDGAIIIEGNYESIKECLEKNRGADLSGSDLRGSNLSDSDLNGSDLRGSNFGGGSKSSGYDKHLSCSNRNYRGCPDKYSIIKL